MDFVHLCVHSDYTILGGTASVVELAAQAASEGMQALALTDTNALYGAVRFTNACRGAGLKPILGMTVNVTPPEDSETLGSEGSGILVLLADGHDGYRSLCAISSAILGQPSRQRASGRQVGWDLLRQYRKGIIALSGGRLGWPERLMRAGKRSAANRYLSQLAGVYEDAAYVSLELHKRDDELLALEMRDAAGRFGIQVAAVQPVYCLKPADQARLRLLAAIESNCRLENVTPAMLPDRGDPEIALHWLTAAEVSQRFSHLPAALEGTAAIVDRCQPALPTGRTIWPALKLPDGESAEGALQTKAWTGLQRLYGAGFQQQAADRLRRELDVIIGEGFAPLFLIVADIVRYAREHNIPVSTRGSVANSLLAYVCGITSVDPVAHDLLFERFLSPGRQQHPDIDLDICSRRRDEVFTYLRESYGEERFALVATVSTFRLRSAIRETAKACGLDVERAKHLVRKLPDRWHPDPRRRLHATAEAVIAGLEDGAERRVVADAYALVDHPHHLSVHPGGVVLAPGPLVEYAPVQWTAKGYVITQFDHSDIETIGLAKLDLLGIRALTVLADASDLIARQDGGFRIVEVDPTDQATADLLAAADTIGVFQCESWGARRTLRQLQAKSIADLAVANAFFKPGPATGGMAASFIRRYRGEEAVHYLHPSLEPILARTKGVLLFQEQILRVAVEVAGLSWEQADHLRRGMSKFLPHEMASMREAFVTGCQRSGGPGFSHKQAETLWNQVQAFAGYGFNQGHATAYADVSYRSAYLKAHFPAEFLCARLQEWGGFHHPAIYAAEARRLGFTVRPPHINHSRRNFSLVVENGGSRGEASQIFWMGLGQIRELRQRSMRAIITARRSRPFTDLRDLVGRVPLQAKEVMHLIQCGALDGLGLHRAAMLSEYDVVVRTGSAQQLAFDLLVDAPPSETPAERLGWEMKILGQPVSVHPLDAVSVPADVVSLSAIKNLAGQRARVAAARLPGWTGGKGVFVGDRLTFCVAMLPSETTNPRPWQPLLLEGRWARDEWGMEWLEVDNVTVIGST